MNAYFYLQLIQSAKSKKIIKYLLFFAVIFILFSAIIPFIPILLIISLIGNPSEDLSTKTEINQETKSYSNIIQLTLEQYSMDKSWKDVVNAIIMQESAGKGLDPMQSSESPYNTSFPNEPNGIQDPIYSIDVGIRSLKNNMDLIGINKPQDSYEKLKILIQSYNYGSGYIDYVNENGGSYSLENASDFSIKQQEDLGLNAYGDPQYVPHVWRYLPTSYPDLEEIINTNPGEENKLFANPLQIGTYSVTQWYGENNHLGIDLGASEGTNIYASADGYISFAGYGLSQNGFNGYGNCVLISHENGYYTMYGHAVKLYVKTGQRIKKGQLIAGVGNTGNSFGNHLHFEIRKGYQYPRVNPSDYINF